MNIKKLIKRINFDNETKKTPRPTEIATVCSAMLLNFLYIFICKAPSKPSLLFHNRACSL